MNNQDVHSVFWPDVTDKLDQCCWNIKRREQYLETTMYSFVRQSRSDTNASSCNYLTSAAKMTK